MAARGPTSVNQETVVASFSPGFIYKYLIVKYVFGHHCCVKQGPTCRTAYHTNHITEVFIPLFVYFILKDMHVMGQHLKMRVKRSDKVVCAENWDGQKV